MIEYEKKVRKVGYTERVAQLEDFKEKYDLVNKLNSGAISEIELDFEKELEVYKEAVQQVESITKKFDVPIPKCTIF